MGAWFAFLGFVLFIAYELGGMPDRPPLSSH
jgi:hypothetical protein